MKYRLNQKKKQFLVSLHVISVASWIGGTLGMLVLGLYMQSAVDEHQLHYTVLSMEVIDENLLKYPALLSLLTGILLSIWTQWGLFKHYWITIKLTLTLLTISIGILFLNKWTAGLIVFIDKFGFASLQNQDFQNSWLSIIITGSFNLLCLLFMIFITYYKPFGKIKSRRKQI